MSGEPLFYFWQFLLLEATFAALVFAVVACVARLWPNASPRLRFGLWSLVFMRLVLPTELAFGLSLPSLLRRVFAHESGTTPAMAGVAELPLVSLPQNLIALPATHTVSWLWPVLTLFWCLGAFTYLRAYWRTRARFRLLAANAEEVTQASTLALLSKWTRELGIRRRVRLVCGNPSVSPFTIGWLQPVIFLPRALRPETLEAVIAHEAAHIKRGDDLWIRLQSLLGAVYFFHPAVWWAARELDHERERICDGMVISRGKITANTYGRGILEVLRLNLEWTPATAALGSRGRKLEKRIRSLTGYQADAHTTALTWMGIAIAGLFLLPMAVGAGSESVPVQEPVAPVAARQVTLGDPLPGARVSSAFGQRRHPINKNTELHRGTDLVAPAGATIRAPADGTVALATRNYEKGAAYGTVVLIDHHNGIQTFYAHLEKLLVEPGHKIARGEPLGTPGSTGQSTAPHLHFEVWRNGQPIDPALFLPGLGQ